MCPSPVITFMTEMTKMKYPTLTRDKIKKQKRELLSYHKKTSQETLLLLLPGSHFHVTLANHRVSSLPQSS